ncbi:recombinase family protein [Sorangium sp. So ce315]|uniref:recombinase family protein n=1 Tax=Sorangium sp. So ce315 TaxID=3133299 RepID=UPI003F5F2BBD
MKKIALYTRVSSDRQAQQATVDSQVTALKERAFANGHHVLPADLYVDDGCSGATLIRPALERLRDRIAEGAIDVLDVHSPDRLARRYAYQVLLLEEFSARGVSVVLLQGASGGNAEDQLLVQVQGMLAEYERARLAERCRRGKLHRARQGMVNPLSTAPYGYRYVRRSDAEPAHYEIVRSEANVVRAIFGAFVHQQMPLRTIARRLNTQQIPTSKGGCWRASRVHELLRNPAYMGQAAYGKSESVESRPLRPRRSKPRVARGDARPHRRRPADQWISIPVPPIVPAEVFAAAREQVMRNRQLSQRHARGQRYLLQGLVVCARCGYAFCGRSASKPSSSVIYRYYCCSSEQAARDGVARACNNRSIHADVLDAQVWDSAGPARSRTSRAGVAAPRRCRRRCGRCADRARSSQALGRPPPAQPQTAAGCLRGRRDLLGGAAAARRAPARADPKGRAGRQASRGQALEERGPERRDHAAAGLRRARWAGSGATRLAGAPPVDPNPGGAGGARRGAGDRRLPVALVRRTPGRRTRRPERTARLIGHVPGLSIESVASWRFELLLLRAVSTRLSF